jgi:alpha-L-fucosidase 2
MQVGRKGDLQEWLDDWDQREASHRHISSLYGLYPGHQVTRRRTPALADAGRVVLEQRGLTGNGWSSAWKAAAWARLGDGAKAMENIVYAATHYTTNSLFSICSKALQVDGAFGMTAAVAELLLQSDDDAIELLPAVPAAWPRGEVRGLRARGGFEVDVTWARGRLASASIASLAGQTCALATGGRELCVTCDGRAVETTRDEQGRLRWPTQVGARYEVSAGE